MIQESRGCNALTSLISLRNVSTTCGSGWVGCTQSKSQQYGRLIVDPPATAGGTDINPRRHPSRKEILTAMIEESYPLSPMQEGMLFHSLYGERLGIYVQQLVCNFSDELDAEAFNCAWQYVLKRHGILRASFHTNGGAILQEVHSEVDLPLVQEDWRNLPDRKSVV